MSKKPLVDFIVKGKVEASLTVPPSCILPDTKSVKTLSFLIFKMLEKREEKEVSIGIRRL